jgi:ferric-dicitrate binding protein FerR (iron transport regulator)
MNPSPEPIPWDLLVRYAAGETDAAATASLSRRVETDPAVAAALADVLLHAVLARDAAETTRGRGSRAEFPPPRRAILRWTALAAALLLLGGLAWLAPGRPEPAVVTLTRLDGAARWTGADGEVRDALHAGSSLPGGLLETVSDQSTLGLAFADGTTLTLLGRAAITISDDADGKTVRLRSGSLSADVRPQPPGRPLRVHTPTALLEVLGTRFDVDSDEANTRLAVTEGRVRLTRLVDGRVAEVPARHEAVASLSGVAMPVMPRRQPQVLWRSDLEAGPGHSDGRWCPADADRPARLVAEPLFLPKSSRGPVTIHRVGLTVPWQDRANIQVQPDSRVRVRGHASRPATLEVMLACRKPSGGSAGNWFRQHPVPAGPWTLDLPVSAFRQWHAQSQTAPQEPLELRHLALYTIQEDAALEVWGVEAWRD